MASGGEGAACWAVSCATVDISPTQPVPLAGGAARAGAYTSLHSKLEANAMCLGLGANCVLFVTLDTFFTGREIRDHLCRVAGRHGLLATQVIVAASHTHFAPGLDRSKPMLGAVDDDYVAFVERQLEQLVDVVLSGAKTEATLSAGQRATMLAVNRRRRWPFPTVSKRAVNFSASTVMAPNPQGARDAMIDVIAVKDGAGRTLCVAWKLACHPVCFPHSHAVSSEFPGVVRERLRDAFGRGIPVLYWQGFSGDTRPNVPAERGLKNWLKMVLQGPGFGVFDLIGWRAWSDALALEVVGALQVKGRVLPADRLDVSQIAIPLADIVVSDDHLEARPVVIQRVGAGSAAELLFVAAEVCSPYLQLLGHSDQTIFCGCAGDVFGYLPSEKQLAEGGYEAGVFLHYFGLRGRLNADGERAVRAAVARLRARASLPSA